MKINPKYNYLDPTYPAYYENFNRPRTFLCFSLRQFVHILILIDIIFSSIGLCFALIYIILDQLNSINIFQSNEFIQNLRHASIGIFFDHRILFRSFWTINLISQHCPIIFYLHILLNGLSLLCSISMLTAMKYSKPYRASIYLIHEAAYFIHTTTIFIRWIADNEKESYSMQLFYDIDYLGFLTTNLNIFCLALLEFVWKSFKMIVIFRSIQYLRDYGLQNENESSTFIIIPNKQFNV